MGESNLGNLYYQLGLKNNASKQLKEAVEDIEKQLSGGLKSVTIGTVQLDRAGAEALSKQIQEIVSRDPIKVGLDTSEFKKAVETALSPGSPIQITISPIISSDASSLKTTLETVLSGVEIKDIKVTSVDKTAIQNAISTSGPYSVTLTANQSDVSKLLTALRQYLNGKSVWVKVDPRMTKADINHLKGEIESRLSRLKLNNVTLNVDRRLIQQQLTAAPFQAELHLNVRQMDVQDAIRQAFAAYGMNWNGLSAAQARSVRANQQQRAADDKHNESLLKQQKLREKLNQGLQKSVGYHKSISDQMKTTTQLVTILGNAIGDVFSVSAVKSFLTEIVKVGGEIQKQNLAMENILGDSFKAHENYQRIRNLAVISPFNVQDLTTYSRRLSAFGVQYNELYDTMKRLADISAGVGTDFSRIALVYGETLERTFLDAKLLRQFSYAGVPMIQKLSELYSKREDSIVTGSDVRKRITNREVSFEDVNEVIKNLTDEGGKFFQMQEVMAESLATKWNNVGVAMDLAFADMADGTLGYGLKKVAEILTLLARNYGQVESAIVLASLALVGYKANSMLASKAMGQNTVDAIKNAQAQKQAAAAQAKVMKEYNERLVRETWARSHSAYTSSTMSQAKKDALTQEWDATKRLNEANLELIATKDRLTMAEYQSMVANKQLTKDQAIMLMLTEKRNQSLSMQEKRMFIAMTQALGISTAERKAALSGKALNSVFAGLTKSLSAFGTAAKSFLLNPFTILFAALEGAMSMWMHFEQKAEESAKRSENIAEKAREGARNLDDIISAPSFGVTPTGDAGFKTAIDEMKNALKDYAPDWQNIFGEIFGTANTEGLKTQEEQYLALKDAILETRDAYGKLAEIKHVIEEANDETEGWFDDSMLQNLKDYQDALSDLDKTIRSHANSYEEQEKLLQYIRENDDAFRKAVTNADGTFKTTAEQLHILAKEYRKVLYDVVAHAENGKFMSFNWLSKAAVDLRDSFTLAEKDIEKALNAIQEKLVQYGYEKGNYSNVQKKDLLLAINTTLNDFGITSEEAKELLYNRLIQRSMIIDVDYKYKDKIADLTQIQHDAFAALGLTGTSSRDGRTTYNDRTNDSPLIKRVREQVRSALVQATSSEAIAKALKELRDEAQATIVRVASKADKTKAENATNQQELDEAHAILEQIEKARAGAGVNLDKEKKTTTTKDTYKEQLQNEINNVKEAYNEYKKWYDLLHDEKAAMDKVKENPLYAGFDKDPREIAKNYEDILSRIDKTKYPDLFRNVQSALFNFNFDDAKQKAAAAVSVLKESMEKDAEDWDLFEKMVMGGIDVDLAKKIAYGSHAMWDQVATDWAKTLSEKFNEATKNEKLPVSISFDMAEEEAKQFFGSHGDENGTLYQMWKSIKDRIEKNGINFYSNIASSASNMSTIENRIKAIEKLRDEAVARLGNNADPRLVDLTKSMYNEQISKLRQEFFEGSDVFRKLTQDTTNFGVAKLAQLRNFAKSIKEAMDQGTVSKNANGDLVRKFTFDGKEYEATEKTYDNIIKKILQLEKKSQSATESFKKMWEWITGKEDAQGAKKTFADIAKDMQFAFSTLSDTASQIGQLFGTDTRAGKTANAIGGIFSGMSSISAGLDAFSSDWLTGTNKILQGINTSVQAIEGLLPEDGNAKVIEALHQTRDAFEKSIGNLSAIMKTQNINDAYESYLKQQKNREELMKVTQTSIADSASRYRDKFFITSQRNYHSIDYYIGQYLSSGDWSRISEEIGKPIRNATDLFNLGSEDWYKLMASLPDIWQKIQNAITADSDNPAAASLIDDIIEYSNMWQKAQEETAAWAEYTTGVAFADVRNGFFSLAQDLESTWSDLTDSFEEQMFNTLVNQKFLNRLGNEQEGLLADYYKLFAQYSASDGQLTQAEIDELRKKYEEIARIVQQIKGEAKTESGWDGGSANGNLSSSISGMQEDTADIMAAYLNGIRGDTAINRVNVELMSSIIQLHVPQISSVVSSQLAQLTMQTEYLRQINEASALMAASVESIDDRFRRVVDVDSVRVK